MQDQASVSRAIISADVAGLLTDADVDCIAVSILASAGQQLLAFPGKRCPKCGKGSLMRVKGVTAVLMEYVLRRTSLCAVAHRLAVFEGSMCGRISSQPQGELILGHGLVRNGQTLSCTRRRLACLKHGSNSFPDDWFCSKRLSGKRLRYTGAQVGV